MPVFNLECLQCGPDDTRPWEVTAFAVCNQTNQASYICRCPDCSTTQVKELGDFDETDPLSAALAAQAGDNFIRWDIPPSLSEGADMQGDPIHDREVRQFRDRFAKFGSITLQNGHLVPVLPETGHGRQ